jgi:hypothetical protein
MFLGVSRVVAVVWRAIRDKIVKRVEKTGITMREIGKTEYRIGNIVRFGFPCIMVRNWLRLDSRIRNSIASLDLDRLVSWYFCEGFSDVFTPLDGEEEEVVGCYS